MYKAHVGIFIMTAFLSLFSLFLASCSMSPAAVCHCVLVALMLYHSPTQIHTNLTVQCNRLALILTLDMSWAVLFGLLSSGTSERSAHMSLKSLSNKSAFML